MDKVLTKTIKKCLNITSTSDELHFLTTFVETLQQTSLGGGDTQPAKLDAFNQHFLKEVVQANPAPTFSLTDIYQNCEKAGVSWTVNDRMDWFLYYVFHRRYGWPDLSEEKSFLLVCYPEANRIQRRSSKSDESKLKPKIVETLDILILWLYHQPVSLISIHMFLSAIRLATASPVTRRHLAVRALEWLKERFDNSRDSTLVEVHEKIKELIILIVTDVWSQIRSAGVSRLGPIVEKLPLASTRRIFEECVQLCDCDNNSWQVTDGAISSINAIIKRFQRIGYFANEIKSASNSSCHLSPRVQYQIRIGSHILDRFPGYITFQMSTLVFNLISNPQLTIRETAIKAYVACLNRCNERESGLAFDEVYNRLRQLGGLQSKNDLEETAPGERCVEFISIDPYITESLLHLLFFVFKRTHDHQSYLENWEFNHETFDFFLMHPASSVRLATSNLYKCFVARSINCPLLVKNIVWSLIRDWKPHQPLLFCPVEELRKNAAHGRKNHRPSVTSLLYLDPTENAASWEWREGRLLVYELLSQFLLKNHYLYTFGQAYRPSIDYGGVPYKNGVACHHQQQGHQNCHRVRQSSLSHPFLVEPLDSGEDNGRESVLSDNSEQNAAFTRWSSFSTSDTALHKIGEISTSTKRHRSGQRMTSTTEATRPRSPSIGSPNTIHTHELNENGHEHRCVSFLAHVKAIEKKEEEAIKRDVSHQAISGEEDEDSRLPSFRYLVCQMFCACAESLVDSQWELRRIAKQTFPCLGELLRWFDPGLLSELMDTHLISQPSLMTYACLTLLRDTLQHTAKLRCLAVRPPLSWHGDLAMSTVKRLLDCVDEFLPRWILSCSYYLQRRQLDCVTPISLHIILLVLVHFKRDIVNPQVLISTLKIIDSAITSSSEDITVLGHGIFPESHQESTSTPKLDSQVISTAAEFCTLTLEHVGEDLLLFMARSELEIGAQVTGLLVSWLVSFDCMKKSDSEKSFKLILQCFSTFVSGTVVKVKSDPSCLSENVSNAIHGIVASVADMLVNPKSLETWWMRQLVEQLLQLLEAIPSVDISCFIRRLLQLSNMSSPNGGTGTRRMSCHQLAFIPMDKQLTFNGSILPSPTTPVNDSKKITDSGVFSTITSSASERSPIRSSKAGITTVTGGGTTPTQIQRRVSVCALPRPSQSTGEPLISASRTANGTAGDSITSSKGLMKPVTSVSKCNWQLYSSLSHTDPLEDIDDSSLEDSDEEVVTTDFPEALNLGHSRQLSQVSDLHSSHHPASPIPALAQTTLSSSRSSSMVSLTPAGGNTTTLGDILGDTASSDELILLGEEISDAGSDWDSDSEDESFAGGQPAQGGQLATRLLDQFVTCRKDILLTNENGGLTKKEISLIQIITSK